ncbi:MAG: S8 family serine peptidase [Burkholderiales bacterium]|nr:S8 family serine peptidase [Burkholderiales bacterium]
MSTAVRRIMVAFAAAVWCALAAAQSGKLDAALTAMAARPADAVASRAVPKRTHAGRDLVQTIVRFEGSLDGLREHGAVVRSVIGNIATVDVPAGEIAAIAARPEIVYMQAARAQRPRLDVSVPATRADALRTGTPQNWTGVTGRGVIVGIVDDGVDFRHRDFRKADGSTRILALWDQRAAGASGSPPAPYAYGGECTEAMINQALSGNAASCAQPSSGGHGTHVAGIAAGNGQATGNGQLAYRMIGMAPDADILAANSIAKGITSDAAVLDGIAWMKTRAAALGKPLVVNLSLGSYYGARDGTSNFEVGLDNLGGPGVILVGAAGNESADSIRATGTITQGGTVTVGFNVPGTVTRGQVELWYPGVNSYGISVTGPGCEATAVVNPGGPAAEIQTPCGLVQITSTAPQANNDDRQILFVVASGTSPLKPGAWSLTLIGNTVAGGSAPFSIICADNGGDLTFTTDTAPNITEILTDVVSAKRVIGVAAYTTRYSWNSAAGPFTRDPAFGALTDIGNFSSRGPRRMCSNPAKCPAVMKPEIAAPGAMILAARAFDTSDAQEPTIVEADGVHVAFHGTSMATPHVTGAVALMLQQSPTLSPEQAKQALFTTRQANSFTTSLPTFDAATPDMPANPNYAWGYGILDAAAAVRSLQPAGSPVSVVEYYHQGFDHYFITWVAAEIANLDSGATKGWARTGQSFKVYPSAQGGTSAVCRIYIPPGKGDGHFFGRDANECDGTMSKNPAFILESSSFFHLFPPNAGNCGAGTVAVYRVFSNRADANHRYTTDRATRDEMVAKGWLAEGDGPDTVVMCAPQ